MNNEENKALSFLNLEVKSDFSLEIDEISIIEKKPKPKPKPKRKRVPKPPPSREVYYDKNPDREKDYPVRTLEWLQKQVKMLITIPKFPQKSQEWLDQRHQLISASDVATCLGENPYQRPKDVILKKCNAGRPFTGNEATRHGNLFEDVIIQIYEKHTKSKVIEFGCLPHPEHSFLGASPDGITTDGIMLEIKCPFKREITGICPNYYWAQIQLQLEVANLNHCDFAEGKLVKYDDEEDYLEDNYVDPETGKTDLRLNSLGLEKGLIARFHIVGEDMYSFKDFFAPLGLKKKEINKWILEIKNEHKDNEEWEFDHIVYWRIEKYSCVRIPRSQSWFRDMFPRLDEFWKKILWHRENGLGDLTPKPRSTRVNDMECIFSDSDSDDNTYMKPIAFKKSKPIRFSKVKIEKDEPLEAKKSCLFSDSDSDDKKSVSTQPKVLRRNVKIKVKKNKVLKTKTCMFSDSE